MWLPKKWSDLRPNHNLNTTSYHQCACSSSTWAAFPAAAAAGWHTRSPRWGPCSPAPEPASPCPDAWWSPPAATERSGGCHNDLNIKSCLEYHNDTCSTWITTCRLWWQQALAVWWNAELLSKTAQFNLTVWNVLGWIQPVCFTSAVRNIWAVMCFSVFYPVQCWRKVRGILKLRMKKKTFHRRGIEQIKGEFSFFAEL